MHVYELTGAFNGICYNCIVTRISILIAENVTNSIYRCVLSKCQSIAFSREDWTVVIKVSNCD